MASENENEKRDTVADILAEMFKFSDKRIEEGRDHAMTSESVGLVVHQLAKRFEAAWTREREELDKRISDLEAYAKLWTGRADELRLKCDEFYAKAKPVGNAAAMREALVKCREIALQWQADEADGVAGTTDKPQARSAAEAVIDMEFEINAALSAPARQCDVGTAEEQADRYLRFCRIANPRVATCDECPLANTNAALCEFAWAQMPYEDEEGGAK